MLTRRKLSALVILASVALIVLFWMQAKKWVEMKTEKQDPVAAWIIEGAIITKEDIAKKWIRVGNDKLGGSWREFSDTGRLSVCYGDMIYKGSYLILDKRTIETKYHISGQRDIIYRWTAGIRNEKLIMINQQTGWVEAYIAE